MAAPLHYSHCTGALYPIDLHSDPTLEPYKKEKFKSLIQICSVYIVQDSTITKYAANTVPQELFIPLMQAALLENKDRAIEVLMSQWPFRTLSLRALVPSLYKSLLPLYDTNYLSDVVRNSLQYTTCLSHTFVENMKKQSPSQLRVLDLSGFPTAELILFYLSSHVMLAHNEVRQSVTVNMYNSTVLAMKRLEPLIEASAYPTMEADNMIPDTSFRIKIDASITSKETYCEVCKALKVSSFEGARVVLCLGMIDAQCLGEAGISLLLSQADPEHVSGLRLKYNSLHCGDLVKVEPGIRRFTHLTSLDLSCNALHVYQDEAACDVLGDTLSGLTELQRLDLSNNRIKTRLRRILAGIQTPLMYLRLTACGLAPSDITYLSLSHHMTSLRELDISENCLSQSVRPLCNLLKVGGQTLLTLELESCSLKHEQIDDTLQGLYHLKSLLYLNISNNPLVKRKILTVIETAARLTSCQVLCISYPLECYSVETESDNEVSRIKLLTVNDMYKTALLNKADGRPKLQLSVVELESMN